MNDVCLGDVCQHPLCLAAALGTLSQTGPWKEGWRGGKPSQTWFGSVAACLKPLSCCTSPGKYKKINQKKDWIRKQ